MTFDILRRASSKGKRILSLAFFFILCIIITIGGTLTPLSAEEAQARKDDLDQLRQDIRSLNFWGIALQIFLNNLRLSLLMFIPLVGPFIGAYILYNTGVYIGAESAILQMPGPVVFLSLFLFPHAWLEFVAYSAAFSANFWLIWRITQREWKRELTRTLLYVCFCAGLLFLGAVAEAFLIVTL